MTRRDGRADGPAPVPSISVTSPLVDVIVAVHTAARPVARAVASVIDHTEAPVRVNVIAHNIDPGIIRTNLGSYANHPQVRLLPYRDGIPSPAGPMNHGLEQSTAPFTTLLGSDDEFAPGAIDSWLTLQQETQADVVLAKIQLASGRVDPYPPVRNGNRLRELDGTKDRLPYRSAPLGLVSRLRFPDLRLSVGLQSGEDLVYSTVLWFTGRHLAYDLRGPAYIVNDDMEDRVTSAPRPFEHDFRFVDELIALPWLADAPSSARTAIVVKILRIHVFDAIAARIADPVARATLRSDLSALLERLGALAPAALALLSRADRKVLDAVQNDPSLDAHRISALLAARWNYRTLSAMLPRNPFLTFHPQAPFRTFLAGARTAQVR